MGDGGTGGASLVSAVVMFTFSTSKTVNLFEDHTGVHGILVGFASGHCMLFSGDGFMLSVHGSCVSVHVICSLWITSCSALSSSVVMLRTSYCSGQSAHKCPSV